MYTKTHGTFRLEIDSNRLYRRIIIHLDPNGDIFEGGTVVVHQETDNNFQFSKLPVIQWNSDRYASIADARRFAQAIELAAQIAADIESWLEE